MSRDTAPAPQRSGLPSWAKRAIWIAIAVLVLVITYFILAAFIPGAWARFIGHRANESFTGGVTWGLMFGFVCTFVPLGLLGLAAMNVRKRVRNRPVGRYIAGALAIGALIVALPNLMTLGIVYGSGNGAHQGERTLDVEAPGFRGASLVAAIAGVLVFLLVAFLVVQYRRRGKQLKSVRGQQRAAEAERAALADSETAAAAEEFRNKQ